MIVNTPLTKWIREWWTRYDESIGDRSTMEEFAAYLGTTRGYLGLLLSGKRENPSLDTIYVWYSKTRDPQIFGVCGYPDLCESLAQVLTVEDFVSMVSEILHEMSSHNISDINSPDGAKILTTVFERRGLNKA